MSEKLSLPAKQEAAILALQVEPSYERVAEKVGITPRTLNRWMNTPAFFAAWQESRRQNLRRATSRIQYAAQHAVSCLITVMADKEAPHSARIAAAKTLLETAYRSSEQEDMAERIAALELAAKAGEENKK